MEIVSKQKWIVDTDPGCDDMMALLYLLKREDVDLLMISLVDGNVSLENVAINSRKILKLAGKTIPLYRGSSDPIIRVFDNEESYHYCDGLGDIEEIKVFSAHDVDIERESSIVKLIEYSEKYKGEINLLCLGPLTTIAACYMLNPNFADNFNNIYMMGGSTHSKGNILPASEFNFAYDFIAAHIVMKNFKQILVTPWDPTADLIFRDYTLQKLSHNITGKNKKLNKILFYYVSLIIAKFTADKNGTQLCDLYSVVSAFNKNSIKKVSICKCDIIIDSTNMLGMLVTQIRKELEDIKSFDINLTKNLCKANSEHIIIEELDECIICEEYESVFTE